jgi:uncharacterized phiE125 gp8 family phage protein
MAAFTLTTEPASEPVTLAEAKAQCRIEVSDDDALVTALIVAARQTAELVLRRALMTQTWTLTLDTFPTAIELAHPPLQAVNSIIFLEAVAGAPTILSPASYIVDGASEPGWIQPANGYDWPQVWPEINAITVEFVCGYANASAVPQAIKQWILLHVAHYYAHREASFTPDARVVMTPLLFADGLLDRYRVLTY